MKCAIASSLNRYMSDLDRRDRMNHLRERYSNDFRSDFLKSPRFVAEEMSAFLYLNQEKMGDLWVSKQHGLFMQELKDHIFDQATKAARAKADEMGDEEIEFTYTGTLYE